MLSISDDGYVRLTLDHLQTVKLEHLVSGLDEEHCPIGSSNNVTAVITGYTEFVSAAPAALTLGWDWRMERGPGDVSLTRLGEPRSNIMLHTKDEIDLGSNTTARLLASFVDTLAWQAAAIDFVTSRYGK